MVINQGFFGPNKEHECAGGGPEIPVLAATPKLGPGIFFVQQKLPGKSVRGPFTRPAGLHPGLGGSYLGARKPIGVAIATIFWCGHWNRASGPERQSGGKNSPCARFLGCGIIEQKWKPFGMKFNHEWNP